MRRRKKLIITGFFLLVFLAFGLWWGVRVAAARGGNGNHSITLVHVEASAKQFTYSHKTLSPALQLLSPILPQFVLARFRKGIGGRFSFGGDGNTNLYLVTHTRDSLGKKATPPYRLRICDEDGNQFDACIGAASTLAWPNEWVHGWNARPFPRRSKRLKLEFFANPEDELTWRPVAMFEIANPLFQTYPQWTPENQWTKTNDDLAVTLEKFESGGVVTNRMGAASDAPLRKTRLKFSFRDHGAVSSDWGVQNIVISDATGNLWAPYFNLVDTRALSWARGGDVQFIGALWPGENAWKLKVEFVRSTGFSSNEVYGIELPLPTANTIDSLTNAWTFENATMRLHAFGAPEIEHPDDFKWRAKWWGEDKEKVYTLALQLKGADQKHRVILVSSVDDSGDNIKVVQHANSNSDEQVIFLKPTENAKSARLVFAVPRSRFVEFVERPEFIFDPSDP